MKPTILGNWVSVLGGGKSCLHISFSKDMSVVIKGIACIMILMSHYSTLVLGGGLPRGISYYITVYAANIALIWFMFFSGYGLALKDIEKDRIPIELKKRILKVYLPLVFVCLVTTLVKAFLGDWRISITYLLGLKDEWYVLCIIYFYLIFYIASYIALRTQINKTLVLSIFMLVYYIIAYHIYGEAQAHYYRFPFSFMVGYVIANRQKNRFNIAVLLSFSLTLIPLGLHYIKCYIMAFAILFIIGITDRLYRIEHGFLFKLGTISFFFYLSHQRIGYPIMNAIGISSCVLWIIITSGVAIALQVMFNSLNRATICLSQNKSLPQKQNKT
ncbi:MAG: acyltransferase family protein [Paraprevotella sp.]|nr:acyltransferase family protein [Paraprevotella sp.]